MINVIEYNAAYYQFKLMFEGCLGPLEDIHANHDLKPSPYNTKGGIQDPDDNTFYGLIEKLFKEVVHNGWEFKLRWKEFQLKVLKPIFGEEKIVVQELPSIKIFPSGYEWLYVENPIEIDGRKVNRHLDQESPFYHPIFETTFVLPLTDMDEDNGLFVEDEMYTNKYGEMLYFNNIHHHGGYVYNRSKNSRVTLDFKALPHSKYDVSILTDKLIKKRGKLIEQKEFYRIGNYYTLI